MRIELSLVNICMFRKSVDKSSHYFPFFVIISFFSSFFPLTHYHLPPFFCYFLLSLSFLSISIFPSLFFHSLIISSFFNFLSSLSFSFFYHPLFSIFHPDLFFLPFSLSLFFFSFLSHPFHFERVCTPFHYTWRDTNCCVVSFISEVLNLYLFLPPLVCILICLQCKFTISIG